MQGGFGNLIALPLQKEARDRGNTVFVDDHLVPYSDQWAFLSNVRRLERRRIEQIVTEGEHRGRIVGVRLPAEEDDDEPWTAPPSRRRVVPLEGALPESIDLVLGNEIYIAKAG